MGTTVVQQHCATSSYLSASRSFAVCRFSLPVRSIKAFALTLDEISDLVENGFDYGTAHYDVVLHCFVGDDPFVRRFMGALSFGAKHGCYMCRHPHQTYIPDSKSTTTQEPLSAYPGDNEPGDDESDDDAATVVSVAATEKGEDPKVCQRCNKNHSSSKFERKE